jgi:hypothetical protein
MGVGADEIVIAVSKLKMSLACVTVRSHQGGNALLSCATTVIGFSRFPSIPPLKESKIKHRLNDRLNSIYCLPLMRVENCGRCCGRGCGERSIWVGAPVFWD